MITWLVLSPIVYGITDSRAYRFPFALRSPKDLPGDFCHSRDLRDFSSGVFLPQFERGRGDTPYPPTAILRHESQLIVAPRGQRHRIIPFSNIRYIEYGHFLMQGWIDFLDLSTRTHLPFNALMSSPIEEFLRRLTPEYRPSNQRIFPRHTAAPLNLPLKFQSAEGRALSSEEQVFSRFFSCTTTSPSGSRMVHREGAGDYLALTSRRLVWITDRHRGWYERYGSVLRFVSLKNVAAIHIGCSEAACTLTCRLQDGSVWCIPLVGEAIDNALAFIERVRPIIHSRLVELPE